MRKHGHLPVVPKMTERLRALAENRMAPVARRRPSNGSGWDPDAVAGPYPAAAVSYVPGGSKPSAAALDGIDDSRPTLRLTPALLRRRSTSSTACHDVQSLPARHCRHTQRLRAWRSARRPRPGCRRRVARRSEPWPDAIAMSLDTPWEDQRQDAALGGSSGAGLFRGLETPHWELPPHPRSSSAKSGATKHILDGWLPASTGAAPRLLRRSPGCSTPPGSPTNGSSPTSSSCTTPRRGGLRLDAARLTTALTLYRRTEGKPRRLEDLVPKYLAKLPADPYTGKSFGYRLSAGERIDELGKARSGQGIVWMPAPTTATTAAGSTASSRPTIPAGATAAST